MGAANTAATYGLFALGTLWMPAWATYLVAYVSGIAIAFLGNGRWVFATRVSPRAIVPYAALQCALMGIGPVLTRALGAGFAVPALVAGLGAMAVTVPLSFLANLAFFSAARAKPAPPAG